ncbi:MAG TPA: 1,4-alpha-glucan branching protein domain-containing protein [Gemmatimonadales bacterium]|nr:1,4-alpha-glucan branching protein domain-containing protein [Gemmatimonadales bacterium]
MNLRFVLTLHSHLPWVLHHGRWPHGSDWLCEAALDSYLPLVAVLDRLEAEGVPSPITLGITPILAAQFAHPSFRDELDAYFQQRLLTLEKAPASLAASGDLHLLPLIEFWRAHIEALRATWHRIEYDLIGAFRRHAQAGRIELISSAATHGFLPLLARDESIRLQLLTGRAEHVRHFGDVPAGCWVPECAYRPRGPWQPLPSAPKQAMRRGIEDHLQHAGFQWFFVDGHLVDAGEATDIYGGSTRPRTTSKRSPYRAYQVGRAVRGKKVSVLVRDPEATAQVWSRHGGYPGDVRYLEFHKLYPGGLKLWSVTDHSGDLGAKQPYQPATAEDAALTHAGHFRDMLDSIAGHASKKDRAVVAPFDTELFGHWWFEGMDFLFDLYQIFVGDAVIAPSTAGAALAASPPTTALRMSAGSWGADGDFSMWLNDETAWTWERLWPLEERFWNVVPAAMRRIEALPILEQAARELLLAQSSDWQFIISTGAAGDYATERFNQHCDALERLLAPLEHPELDLASTRAFAAALERIDGPFPDLIGAIAAASDVTAP